MSISRAPARTLSPISAMRRRKGDRPAGKPVETAATGMDVPSSARTAAGTISWYTQTAPVVIPGIPSASSSSARTGWRALAQRRCTRPSVSSPVGGVRSISVIAFSSQAA